MCGGRMVVTPQVRHSKVRCRPAPGVERLGLRYSPTMGEDLQPAE